MEIVRPAADAVEYLGIWRMLQETVNKNPGIKAGSQYVRGSVQVNHIRQPVSGVPVSGRAWQDTGGAGRRGQPYL